MGCGQCDDDDDDDVAAENPIQDPILGWLLFPCFL
jgi:hypothetical protein